MGKKDPPPRDSKEVNPRNKPDIEEMLKEEKTDIGKYRKKGPVRRKY
jgi:hypothetical protein